MTRREEDVPFLSQEREKVTTTWQSTRAWISRAGRRQLLYAITAITTLLILLTLVHPNHPARQVISYTTGYIPSKYIPSAFLWNACGSDWPNSGGIKAPLNPDIQKLTAFWPELKRSLDLHGRDLPTLGQPEVMGVPVTMDEVTARSSLLNETEYDIIRQRHSEFIHDLPPYPKNTFKGRGIVMLAGGSYSEYAVTSLGMLRASGCTLPVEVWRRDEREEKKDWCREIEKEGMACRRLSDYLDTDLLSIADGKEMKIFTMLFSSFEDVLFMDADNLALQNPELLFDSKPYRETGAMLWPDFWTWDNIDWMEYVVGLADNRTEWLWGEKTFESGQVVWNKSKHWKSLLLATYYNWYGPQLWYTFINIGWAGWGDKDTFPLALRALKEPFYTVQHEPKDTWVVGRVGDRRIGMLQFEPTIAPGRDEEKAIFMHSTSMKWSHRDMFCVKCLPLWHTDQMTDGYTSRYEDEGAEFYNELRNAVKLMDEDICQWTVDGVDPEKAIWRAVEHAACRSPAWRHARTCQATRKYLVEAFGFEFKDESGTKLHWTSVPDMSEQVCLVDPT